jgi:hypothetical protein
MPSLTVDLRQTGASVAEVEAFELLELFLGHAGFSPHDSWEARVEQTTPPTLEDKFPVRVFGFRRQFVFVRVQPAVDPPVVVTLRLSIPPNGKHAVKSVYQRLRRHVNSFSRRIRTQGATPKETETAKKSEGTSTAQDDTSHEEARPAPSGGASTMANSIFSKSLEFATLTGVTRHPEKLRYALKFVDQASKTAPGSAMAFKKAFRKAAGWSDQPIRAVALVLAWLCKHDYVVKIRDDQDQVINYHLTPRGASLAFSGTGAPSGPVLEGQSDLRRMLDPMLSDLDLGTLLIRFRDKAQALADAGKCLETNREKYRQLQLESKKLDEEYNDIARILVANREMSALLCRLMELQGTASTGA